MTATCAKEKNGLLRAERADELRVPVDLDAEATSKPARDRPARFPEPGRARVARRLAHPFRQRARDEAPRSAPAGLPPRGRAARSRRLRRDAGVVQARNGYVESSTRTGRASRGCDEALERLEGADELATPRPARRGGGRKRVAPGPRLIAWSPRSRTPPPRPGLLSLDGEAGGAAQPLREGPERHVRGRRVGDDLDFGPRGRGQLLQASLRLRRRATGRVAEVEARHGANRG